MTKKETDRRGFLQYAGLGLLAAYSGCYGAISKNLGRPCPTPPKLETKLRVMSYNIANARGNFDDIWKMRSEHAIKGNLDQIIRMSQYEGIDVLCMNEVDFDSKRTHNIDQAEYIAKGLCYNHVIKERIFSFPGIVDVGNAIVSRYPLKLNSSMQYGGPYIASRICHIFKSLVDFDVEYEKGRSLNMVLTHLDHWRKKTRLKQTAMLIRHLRKKRQPFILLGDFNSGPGMPAYDSIIKSGLVHNPYAGIPTFRAHKPTASKDHILVSRELNIKNYHVIWAEMSDHRPVVGDVILSPP
jgi:endonuclease/exonuclease/phosphatase family metal-dependent hydrolase